MLRMQSQANLQWPTPVTLPLRGAPTAAASLCHSGPAQMYMKYPGSVATMPTPRAASSKGECGANMRSRGATRPVTSANSRAKKSTWGGNAVKRTDRHTYSACSLCTASEAQSYCKQPRFTGVCMARLYVQQGGATKSGANLQTDTLASRHG